MAAYDSTRVGAVLRSRRAVIADHWYVAIRRTSFAPRPATDIRGELTMLVERAIAILLSEPFNTDGARTIGAALTRMHYLRASTLEQTLAVLGGHLTAGLPDDQVAALQPRLAALLGAIAAGFYEQGRNLILEEQEHIRQALFVSRQEAEAAEEARAIAEAAVRVRTDVVNAVAHDLRNPLTTILGQVTLLQQQLERHLATPGWIQNRAEAIHRATLRMQTMVEELLDVARLERGQDVNLEREHVDLSALVQDVARARMEQRSRRAAPIIVNAVTTAIVIGDRHRLERVFNNLIGNAVKYSPNDAPIDVTVRVEGHNIVVGVRDQGIGIPANELPHLFTPFYRASTARNVPGIGIGLAGAKMIVEQHGGHMSIDSAVGQGTTVTLVLPATDLAAPAS